jgi:putative Holliday junction resolvase
LTQEKETTKGPEFLDTSKLSASGRVIALDPGTKRIGVAVCDVSRSIARPLPRIRRSSWKKLLAEIRSIAADFDAVGVVIGLPLETDGSESPMSADARRIATNLSLSLDIPVFLQDERLTSYEAKGRLWEQGADINKTRDLVDSEAAAIILSDFLDRIRASKNL